MESLIARWGWEAYDPKFSVWLPRRVRFTSLREAHEHVACAQALGIVARVVDFNPPRPVIKTDDTSLSWTTVTS